MAVAHPGPLLADWVGAYHTHPLDNSFTEIERDLLSSELITSPSSRVYAALTGGVPLDTWALVSLAGMTANVVGVELHPPTMSTTVSAAPPADDVSAEEMRRAREVLAAHSVINQLPGDKEA